MSSAVERWSVGGGYVSSALGLADSRAVWCRTGWQQLRRWVEISEGSERLAMGVVWGDLEKWERMIIFADNFEF